MIAETAKCHLGDVFGKLVEVIDLDGAGGAEVAHIGVVRTFSDIHRPDQLRDQKVDICVALPVAMSRHVDGHAVDPDRKIGAVIKIEAAQEILVGLTLSGMLGDDQAGHDLKRLAGPQEGHGIHISAADGHGAGRGRLHVCRPRSRRPGSDAAADLRWDRRARLNRGWISRGLLTARRLGPVARPRLGRIHRHRGKLAGRSRRDVLGVRRGHHDKQGCSGGKCPPSSSTQRSSPA
jgi:hypothetical protein